MDSVRSDKNHSYMFVCTSRELTICSVNMIAGFWSIVRSPVKKVCLLVVVCGGVVCGGVVCVEWFVWSGLWWSGLWWSGL